MSPTEDDLKDMTREELLDLILTIRGWLDDCEDASGFCLDVGELLGVEL